MKLGHHLVRKSRKPSLRTRRSSAQRLRRWKKSPGEGRLVRKQRTVAELGSDLG